MEIGCILVTYNPDFTLLLKSLKSIEGQVDELCLLDNSTNELIINQMEQLPTQYTYMKMSNNVGIALAQNIGLEYFLRKNYDFIIFMDQDSIAPDNLVEQLMLDYEYLKEREINVGGVGPRPINRQNNKEYKGSIKKGISLSEGITEVTELINSASLIPLSNFQKVGLMEASLFIDAVDHEWCWRARKLISARFFISEKVKLSHQLGEGDRFLLGRQVAISSSFRMFFQYRNYLLLLRRGYVPLYWKLLNGFKYTVKFFYYPLCVSPRKEYLRQILRGIKAGILGKV